MTMSARAPVTLKIGAILLAAVALAGCPKKQPPIARPTPPPPGSSAPGSRPPAPPEPVVEPPMVPPEPVPGEGDLSAKDLDALNRDSPLQAVYFDYDSADISDAGQKTLNGNADVLKRYSTWVVTVEGHADERGTAEYNLSLGERRALAVRNYLVSLGISPDRLRTVSYGEEFPFAPGHDAAAWAKNRRAHFVITAKEDPEA